VGAWSRTIDVRAASDQRIFELPASKLITTEFADLMPLMAEPDHYRTVEKNLHRALHGLKSA
jgi:hypothetical protein